jgi:hypothetical protein
LRLFNYTQQQITGTHQQATGRKDRKGQQTESWQHVGLVMNLAAVQLHKNQDRQVGKKAGRQCQADRNL